LLSTIRCPRNFNLITERLPKPQYNSLLSEKQTPEIETKALLAKQSAVKPLSTPKVVSHSMDGRIIAKPVGRAINKLPTIMEDEEVVNR